MKEVQKTYVFERFSLCFCSCARVLLNLSRQIGPLLNQSAQFGINTPHLKLHTYGMYSYMPSGTHTTRKSETWCSIRYMQSQFETRYMGSEYCLSFWCEMCVCLVLVHLLSSPLGILKRGKLWHFYLRGRVSQSVSQYMVALLASGTQVILWGVNWRVLYYVGWLAGMYLPSVCEWFRKILNW